MPIGYLRCIQFGWVLPALAEGLALQLFFDDLLGYLGLEFFLSVHLIEPTIFIF